MKIPNLLVILSLISFLSIILVTGFPLKSYSNFYENNNHILLKITPIYAQGNSGDFEDGDIFPDFKAEDGGGEKNGDIFPGFEEDDSGDGSSSGSGGSSINDDDDDDSSGSSSDVVSGRVA